jgi:hypothetical protein
MATRFFSFLFVLLFYCSAISQNLVPNPSFEDYANECPLNLNEMPLFWGKWRSSPNSFNTCVEPQNLTDSLGWAPWNGFGYQEPATGDSYVGMYAFPSPSPGLPNDYREYIGCELLEPLIVGTEYYVSFKTSLGYGGYYYPLWASSHIGAIFTTQGYNGSSNPMPIPNFAHVYIEEIFSDTLNWVLISGVVVADVAYTHLGIGVFFEFELLNIENLDPSLSSLGSYFYIDDVCISKFPDCKLTTSVSSKTLAWKIYPNPAGDSFRITGIIGSFNLSIYSLSGQKVGVWYNLMSDNEIDTRSLKDGVYILELEQPKSIKREKLVVAR